MHPANNSNMATHRGRRAEIGRTKAAADNANPEITRSTSEPWPKCRNKKNTHAASKHVNRVSVMIRLVNTTDRGSIAYNRAQRIAVEFLTNRRSPIL